MEDPVHGVEGPARRAETALPYRGSFGEPRPPQLASLPLPPGPMPSHHGLRPLKAWRYVGIYSPQMMLCVGRVRVGPLRQSFWAVWDREHGRLYERTLIGDGQVELAPGRVNVSAGEVRIELALAETAGVETISRTGRTHAWTRKQGGVRATGSVAVDGVTQPLEARGVIDDSAGYFERHTRWSWCAGVGRSADERQLAWNLVEGLHDAARSSERTVWIDGVPREAEPCEFAADLGGVGDLRFVPEAVRARRDNLLVVRSQYRQPFGRFSGELPGGAVVADGYGVMEAHDAWW